MSDDPNPALEGSEPGGTPEPASTKKETKMVPEKDLLAVKSSAKKEMETAQTAHETAITDMQAKLSTAANSLATAEAKVQTLEEEKSQSVSSEELTRAKDELKAAKESSEGLATKVLEYRRKNIVTGFGIPEDAIKDKTIEQLGHLEEALTLVKATGGTGNYAAGGGGGGGATPERPIERAARVLEEAEARGPRGGGSPTKD